MAQRHDFYIEQGTTWQYGWPVTDDQGNAVDLTGYTVKAQVKANVYEDNPILHEWSTSRGNVLIQNSTVILTVSPEDSRAWGWSDGLYDVTMTSPTGDVTRLAQGHVSVDMDITR